VSDRRLTTIHCENLARYEMFYTASDLFQALVNMLMNYGSIKGGELLDQLSDC